MSECGIKKACECCPYENWSSVIKWTLCRAQRSRGTFITEDPSKSGSNDVARDWNPSREDQEAAHSSVQTEGEIFLQHVKRKQVMIYVFVLELDQSDCMYPGFFPAQDPSKSRQSLGSGSRPVVFSVYPCEEYNDRNKLNTRTQHWICFICTYENWVWEGKKCVVCDHSRRNNVEVI